MTKDQKIKALSDRAAEMESLFRNETETVTRHLQDAVQRLSPSEPWNATETVANLIDWLHSAERRLRAIDTRHEAAIQAHQALNRPYTEEPGAH